jgi:hypothetical protein
MSKKIVASYLVRVVLKDDEGGDLVPPTNEKLALVIEAAISEELGDLAPEYITAKSERLDK